MSVVTERNFKIKYFHCLALFYFFNTFILHFSSNLVIGLICYLWIILFPDRYVRLVYRTLQLQLSTSWLFKSSPNIEGKYTSIFFVFHFLILCVIYLTVSQHDFECFNFRHFFYCYPTYEPFTLMFCVIFLSPLIVFMCMIFKNFIFIHS